MNFSSILFLNLVNLLICVSKERMLLQSADLKFSLDCGFKPEVIAFWP